MSYRLDIHADPGVELKRVVAEQAEKALSSLSDQPDRMHEAVHDARKRCKKIRAAFRLCRPALGDLYDRENARYRDAARQVSGIRDATAIVETVRLLRDLPDGPLDDKTLARLEEGLARRRDRAVKRLGDVSKKIDRARKAIEQGLGALPRIDLPQSGFAIIEGGLAKTYGRARDRFRDCCEEPSDELIHTWRKRTKYHWYHLRLIEPAWPAATKPSRKLCKKLSDVLGDERDLMLLSGALEDGEMLPESETWALLARISTRRQTLRNQALAIGERLFAEKPGALTRRIGAYWNAEAAEASR